MNKRQQSALETQEKILESATRLIAEKGFANVSVEEITKDCKVAKGSFYVYFKKKEDIIDKIGQRMFEDLKKQIDSMTDKDILFKIRYYTYHFMLSIEQSSIEICRQWTKNVLDTKNCDKPTKLDYDLNVLREILGDSIQNFV